MKSTKNIKIPKKLVDQVLGQEEAVLIIKKAALQRRHVLLIGDPGTGKRRPIFPSGSLCEPKRNNRIVGHLSGNDTYQISLFYTLECYQSYWLWFST